MQVKLFWDEIDTNFPHYRAKPHFVAIGRREAELMGGCGVSDKMYTKVQHAVRILQYVLHCQLCGV